MSDLREGWTAFRSLTWVVTLVVAYAATNLILSGVWLILGPTIALDTIGATAWGLTLSAQAAGLLVMGVALYEIRFRYFLRLGQMCAVLPALPFVVLGLNLGAAFLIISAFIAGLGTAVANISWETSLQEHVRPELLSRVASYDNLGSFVTVPIGGLVVSDARRRRLGKPPPRTLRVDASPRPGHFGTDLSDPRDPSNAVFSR